MFVVFALVLFASAGTIRWLAGWCFLILFFGFVIALSLWLLRHNPALLTERMTGIGNAGQQRWDKVFFVIANVLFLTWLILMPLDAVRFHWSRMPVLMQTGGAALSITSFFMFFLTFRENSWLSPAVRVQTEREHTVVTTGPYRYVRHPMYAAALVFIAATTLLLGSWYGLIGGMVIVIAMAIRSVAEERLLRTELPGYDTYMKTVKYRLVPYVW
ncbi:MAG TPA: isoprenylcysteine carboxylmethyltransferase family protein [Thermoanaerobaculia bacterium]